MAAKARQGGPVSDSGDGVNQWKGTRSPPWQKPGARQDKGKLQKQIELAFVAAEGKPLSPDKIMEWC
jgi:hypothetical protein